MNETTSLKDGDSISRPGSPAASDIDFEAGGGVDFEIEEDPAAEARDDGGLSVDMSSKDDSSLGGRAGRRSGLGDLEISGLDENGEESSKSTASSKSAKKKKRKDAANKKGPKRMKKRRKIVIDNNATELSSDHMKAMLRDTSDIVLQNVPDLAAWPREDDGGDDDDAYVGICPALQRLPTERLLARPCIGDDGELAPELLALWMRNTVRVEGKAGTQLPFRMRGARGREQRGAAAERVAEDEARRHLEEGDEEGSDERRENNELVEENTVPAEISFPVPDSVEITAPDFDDHAINHVVEKLRNLGIVVTRIESAVAYFFSCSKSIDRTIEHLRDKHDTEVGGCTEGSVSGPAEGGPGQRKRPRIR